MCQDAAETLGADVALTDVCVPVQVRSQRPLGIVGVDHMNVLHSEDSVGFTHSLLQTWLTRDVEARRQQVASVQAVANLQVGLSSRKRPNHLQFFQSATDVRATTGCVLQQHCHVGCGAAVRSFRQSQHKCRNGLLQRLPAIAARMGHQVLRPNRLRAFQFAAERRNRLLANYWLDRRQVDQIIDVNGEWTQIQPLPCPAKRRDFVFGWHRRPPHSRTGREDLKSVGPQLGRFQRGFFK